MRIRFDNILTIKALIDRVIKIIFRIYMKFFFKFWQWFITFDTSKSIAF